MPGFESQQLSTERHSLSADKQALRGAPLISACKAALSSYPCLCLASAALMLGFESPVRLRQWMRLGKPTTIASIIGSYQCEHVRSRPISETKHVWANSVLRSGTTRESLVIYVFIFFRENQPHTSISLPPINRIRGSCSNWWNASASSVKIGTIQRRLAWPLRKDDTAKIENVSLFCSSKS